MKTAQIRFFNPLENSKPKEKKATKSTPVTGYISPAGKIVFPVKSVALLDFDPETAKFKIGMDEGKRKIKSLYLVLSGDEEGTFALDKAAKSYSISMPVILQNNGIDFSKTKYVFTVKPFDYDDSVSGYELQLEDQAPKAAYTGKPRGRKPINRTVE